MKTEQQEKQPAPVLAWHREAAKALTPRSSPVPPHAMHDGAVYNGLLNQTASVIAAHDPHAETVRLLELALNAAEGYQKCVRLLEEASGQYVNSAQFFQLDSNMKEIRTHLAKLKGTL